MYSNKFYIIIFNKYKKVFYKYIYIYNLVIFDKNLLLNKNKKIY